MTIAADHNAMARIRAEYLEMPGMSLTLEQVQRLCGVERSMCRMVLNSLVAMKFLYVKTGGAYARLTAESTPRPQPATAHLTTVASPAFRRAS